MITAGAGLGSPGTLDRQTGRVLFSANLPTFKDFALVPELAQALNLPVALENDANLFGLGEFHFGAGQGQRDLACFTLGTGVGGGVILDGRLVVGPLGIGGELGHSLVVPEGRLCACGAPRMPGGLCLGHGFAWYAGRGPEGRAGFGFAARQPGGPDSPGRRGRRCLGEGAFRHRRQILGAHGGPGGRCSTAWTWWCWGGGMAQAWSWMEPAARQALSSRLRILDAARVDIVTSLLGFKAPLWGAAALARDRAREAVCS